MSSRQRFVATAIVGLMTMTACSDTSSPSPSQSVGGELRIGYAVTAEPQLVAKTEGLAEKFTKEVGGTARWIKFTSGRDEINALVAGSVDVIMVSGVPTASALARGIPVRVIWQDDVSNSEGIAVKASKRISSIAGLKGHKVGVVFNSSTHYLLASALKHFNVPSSAVTLVNLDPPGLVAAWQQGSIDAGSIWYPPLGQLVSAGGTLLLSGGQFKGIAGTYSMPSYIVTIDTALAAKRHLLKAYLKALDEATKLVNADPNAAAASAWQEYGAPSPASLADELKTQSIFPIAVDQLKPEWMGTPGSLGATVQATRSIWEFLVTSGVVTGSVNDEVLRAAFDPSLLQEVASECGPALTNYSC